MKIKQQKSAHTHTHIKGTKTTEKRKYLKGFYNIDFLYSVCVCVCHRYFVRYFSEIFLSFCLWEKYKKWNVYNKRAVYLMHEFTTNVCLWFIFIFCLYFILIFFLLHVVYLNNKKKKMRKSNTNTFKKCVMSLRSFHVCYFVVVIGEMTGN